MKKIVLKITDDHTLRIAQDRLKFLFHDQPMQMTLEPLKTDRTAAQNRLMWAWLTDCENTDYNEQEGHTQKEWHRYFKINDLMPIFMRDDEDYAELILTVSDVSGAAFDTMMDFIIDNTSTTKCNAAQFTEYLTCIERFCGSNGIMLRTDAHLYGRAMGRGA